MNMNFTDLKCHQTFCVYDVYVYDVYDVYGAYDVYVISNCESENLRLSTH